MESSSTSDDPPDPIAPPSKQYRVKRVTDGEISRPIITSSDGSPIAALCNAVILRDCLPLPPSLPVENQHEWDIDEATLKPLLQQCAIRMLNGLGINAQLQDVVEEVSSLFKEDMVPLPSFKGVELFENGDVAMPFLIFDTKLFHWMHLDPKDVRLNETINGRTYTETVAELDNQSSRRRKNGKPIPTPKNWKYVQKFLEVPNSSSLRSILEGMTKISPLKKSDFHVFYWRNRFWTITKHEEALFLLDVCHSSLAGQVIWQKCKEVTGIAAVEYFNSEFNRIELDLDSLQEGSTDTKSLKSEKTHYVRLVDVYGLGVDILVKAKEVQNSLQRNINWAEMISGSISLENLEIIFPDLLQVYSICMKVLLSATASEVPLTSRPEVVRPLKGEILKLVMILMSKADLAEDLEEKYIAPLMDVVLEDYFEHAPDSPPAELNSLSLMIIEKCKRIERIFSAAFNRSIKIMRNNAKYRVYCFLLITKISTHHFEVLTQRAEQFKAKGLIKCALKQIKVANLDYVLELYKNFERNIMDGNLTGKDLDEWIPVIFSDILELYRMCSNVSANGELFETSKEVLSAIFKLLDAVLTKAENLQQHVCIVPFMGKIVNGYVTNVNDKTVPGFEELLTRIIEKCTEMSEIVKSVFDFNLELITSTSEHCSRFFWMISKISTYCPQFIIQLPPVQIKLVMDSISLVVKESSEITGTALLLLKQIFKIFEAPVFNNSFYKEYFLKIVTEIVIVLRNAPNGSDLEHNVLQLLKQLFAVVDKIAVPLWDDKTVPIHYNSIFVRDQIAAIFTSTSSMMSNSEAWEFVDKIYDAKDKDFSLFAENSRAPWLLMARQWIDELGSEPAVPVSDDMLTVILHSKPSYLAKASKDRSVMEAIVRKFKSFFTEFKESGSHSPYYEGVVHALHATGSTTMVIEFAHIQSYDPALALDFIRHSASVISSIKETAISFAKGISEKLDHMYMECKLPHEPLCVDDLKITIANMPKQGFLKFSEFIKLPGNAIYKALTIFAGPKSTVVDHQTPVGADALSSYLIDVCSKHEKEDSWSGNFTQDNFTVKNGSTFEISAPTCGSCTPANQRNDFNTVAAELLPLYGNAALIDSLSGLLKAHINLVDYTPARARRFRVALMINLAYKHPVIRMMLIVDLYKAWKFSEKDVRQNLQLVFGRICPGWQAKVKGDDFLKKVYAKKVDPEDFSYLRVSDPDNRVTEESTSGLAGPHVKDELKEKADEYYAAGTLLLVIIFLRHSIIHVADPEKLKDEETIIKKLIEIDLLLCKVLDEEMMLILTELISNSHLLSEKSLALIEDSFDVYAYHGIDHNIEGLRLRDVAGIEKSYNS